MIYLMKKYDNFKIWLFYNWVYIATFLFFLYVGFHIPIVGDDWEISGWYKEGFLTTLIGCIKQWSYFNGRIINNFADSILSYYNNFWCFFSAGIYTLTLYYISEFMNFKRKPMSNVIMFAMILSVSKGIRSEIQLHIIGNISYSIAICLIFFYLTLIYRENTDKKIKFWQNEKLNLLIIATVSFCASLFIENMTIGLTVANIIICMQSYLKRKKITPYIIWGFTGNILGCLILFTSVGFFNRSTESAGGKNIAELITQNLPIVLEQLVVNNIILFLFFIFITLVSIYNKKITFKNKILNILYISLLCLMGGLIALKEILFLFTVNYYTFASAIYNEIKNTFFNTHKPLSVMLCFLLLILVFIPIIKLIENRDRLIVLYFMGVCSSAPMVISPGNRNLMLTLYCLIAITGYISSNVEVKSEDLRKILVIILVSIIFLRMEIYVHICEEADKITSVRTQIIDDYRLKYYQNRLEKNSWVILPKYDSDIINTGNPKLKDFHMNPLKRYYGLPQEANIIIDDGFLVKNFEANKLSERRYSFVVSQLKEIPKISYTFSILKNGIQVYKTNELSAGYFEYDFVSDGKYSVICNLKNKENQFIDVSLNNDILIRGGDKK